jgi:hypothetical protein
MADFCAYLLYSKCVIESYMLLVRDARGTELLRSYNYRFGVSHKRVVPAQGKLINATLMLIQASPPYVITMLRCISAYVL